MVDPRLDGTLSEEAVQPGHILQLCFQMACVAHSITLHHDVYAFLGNISYRLELDPERSRQGFLPLYFVIACNALTQSETK